MWCCLQWHSEIIECQICTVDNTKNRKKKTEKTVEIRRSYDIICDSQSTCSHYMTKLQLHFMSIRQSVLL